MKIIVENYAFDASEKQIVFTDYNPIILERILVITNVTDGIIIYNFADPSKLGTAATNVLTLAYDTTTMSDTDKLQIFYDDADTAQLVSGTVTVSNPTADPETGLATSAKQDTIDASINTLLKPASTLAAITTVGTIANVVHVDDNSGSLTVDNADISDCKTSLQLLDNSVDGNYLNINMNVAGTDVAGGNGTTSAQTVRVTLSSDSTGQVKLAAGTNGIGKLTANSGVDIGDVDVTSAVITGGATAHDSADAGNPIKIGGRASASPVTAVSANDRVDAFFDIQGRQIVASKAATATASNVSGSASSVTVLAANTARLGATVYNDSTVVLYLKLGATASATSFTIKMDSESYYEAPFGYTGIIDGIWASATGSARVVEVT